jgi:hypothetical protein
VPSAGENTNGAGPEWPAPLVLTLYIQNIKLEGVNVTFSRISISMRINQLRGNDRSRGLDRIFVNPAFSGFSPPPLQFLPDSAPRLQDLV